MLRRTRRNTEMQEAITKCTELIITAFERHTGRILPNPDINVTLPSKLDESKEKEITITIKFNKK